MMTDEHVAPPQSDRQQLVQTRFDIHGLGPVSDWITRQRADGKSWALISRDIHDLVAMDVSYETLRRWSTPRTPAQDTPDADTH